MKTTGLADSPLFVKPFYKKKEKQLSYQNTTVLRYDETMISKISEAIKEFGKEAATYRFTVNEKMALAKIIYHLRIEPS